MDFTLAGIRTRILVDKLDDEIDPQIIDNFINDTQRDIFNEFELPFQEKIFQGTIPAGSTMFQLPADLAQLQSYSMIGVSNFYKNKMAFRDFFKVYPDAVNSTASAPAAWTQYAGNILLSTPTDKDYTFMVYYIKKPVTLDEDTSVPDIPEEFSELLVLGGFKRILERNEDYDLATTIGMQYDRLLNLLVNRYGLRSTDGPIRMKNQQIRR
jgi:hypothetical protein